MSCRAGSDSLSSRSERLHNAHANQLPKQQLPADGSVFLIRLLQLWMVHSNQAARHPPANAAYHTLAGEEKEERVEEEGRRGKRRGKGMKALKKKKKRGDECKKRTRGNKKRKRKKRKEERILYVKKTDYHRRCSITWTGYSSHRGDRTSHTGISLRVTGCRYYPHRCRLTYWTNNLQWHPELVFSVKPGPRVTVRAWDHSVEWISRRGGHRWMPGR